MNSRNEDRCRKALLGLLLFCAIVLSGCRRDPFAYVSVSGKVTYEDGSPIAVDGLRLAFYPQCGPLDAKTHPRVGTAQVDKASGAFVAATTRLRHDGLVRGRHKVTLSSRGGPIPASLVPPEYQDFTRTPLEVDTDRQPFDLKVRRPR